MLWYHRFSHGSAGAPILPAPLHQATWVGGSSRVKSRLSMALSENPISHVLSNSRNFDSAASLRRDSGSWRRNRREETLSAGGIRSGFTEPRGPRVFPRDG